MKQRHFCVRQRRHQDRTQQLVVLDYAIAKKNEGRRRDKRKNELFTSTPSSLTSGHKPPQKHVNHLFTLLCASIELPLLRGNSRGSLHKRAKKHLTLRFLREASITG